MRRALILASLAALAGADAPDKAVAQLLAQANAEYEAAKELWTKLVFDAASVTDEELAQILARYDKAIDLCQKACESGDVPEADTMVLRLARRTAQLRATVFAREMARKAKEAKAKKPEPPPPTQEPPPAGKPPEPTPEAPPAAPETATTLEIPAGEFAPRIAETKEQRSRGLQSARDFLMHFYFGNRKRDALVDACGTCNGRGKVRLPILKDHKPVEQDCGGCGATGYHLNEPVARKGLWLCWSPIRRLDEREKATWQQELAAYKSDPRTVPEFLTRLKIVKIDYQGLWADATWEETGVDASGKKFSRDVSRKLVRAGRQWFFFDPEHDKEMFSGKLEND
jgi:hypothetical protein